MAALTVAAARQRLAAALEALSGWGESGYAPSRFGRDTRQVIHKGFSVEPQTSAPLVTDRQRKTAGAVTDTSFVVRFAYSLRADAQVSDYDAALAAEQTLIQTVLGVSLADLHVFFTAVEARDVSDDGAWFLGAVRFLTIHRLALQ